jgi:hypothetical protein
MKSFKIALILAALGVCVFACSKSSSGGSTPTASLQGNWTFVNEKINPYFDGISITTYDSTFPASSGDYVNFSSGGTLYAQIFGVKDTSAYNLIGTTKVSFNYQGSLDTFAINSLTQTNCTLANTTQSIDTTYQGVSGTAYAIIDINLSR